MKRTLKPLLLPLATILLGTFPAGADAQMHGLRPTHAQPIGPAWIVNSYTHLLEEAEIRQAATADIVAELQGFTGSLDDAGVYAAMEMVRQELDDPGDPPDPIIPLEIDITNPVLAWSMWGGAAPVANIQFSPSQTTLWDTCVEVPETCEWAAELDELTTDIVQGIYTADIGALNTVGLYAEGTIDGVFRCVLLPLYIVPDDALLENDQYLQFALLYRDELFPADLGFLFDGISEGRSAPGDCGGGYGALGGDIDCLTPEVMACIQDALDNLSQTLDRLNRDYQTEYNQILEDAQDEARRCSPVHSLGGFLKFCGKGIITIGIWPVLDACKVWEDFDRECRQLNERYHDKYGDAYRDARDAIMDCLADCPEWLQMEIENAMNIAIAQMGHDPFA